MSFFIILRGVFVAFLVLFGTAYLKVILFAGVNNIGILSSLSQIFPAVMLAFIGWIVKKEYDNFIAASQVANNTKNVLQLCAPNFLFYSLMDSISISELKE